MAISLDLNKSIEQNLNDIYSNIKKNKKKIDKIKEVIEEQSSKISKEKLLKEKKESIDKETIKNIKLKDWFSKFRWFITSNGLLAIGGRDATSNEVIIKKYTQKKDIIFHTALPGSPFFVVKIQDNDLSSSLIKSKLKKGNYEDIVDEIAQATASYSKAWKTYNEAEVFYFKPDQISKEAESGEYLPKGSFMIRGERSYLKGLMKLAIGLIYNDSEVIVTGGPVNSIKNNTDIFVTIEKGNKNKKSDVAKQVKKKLETMFYKKNSKRLNIDVNDVILFLPNGGMTIK